MNTIYGNPHQEIYLPARIENLPHFQTFVTQFAKESGFSQERIQKIELALEEALVNIFKYAYPKKKDKVVLRCETENDNQLTITIIDTGVPFNILSYGEPDLVSDAMERKIGGLGVFLIRKMADKIAYCREKGKNILKLTFINF